METLSANKIKASFFFTGDFYRSFPALVDSIKEDRHYLGSHSDKHLLYADWTKRDSLLVTKEEFQTDLMNNYSEMAKFGIEKEDAQFFLPPYEWYNDSISVWTKELGLTLINFTPGTYSNADYTTPDMGNRYLSSDEIYDRILSYEKKDQNGLNGFILLLHIGTDPKRRDKFYNKLDDLIKELEQRGYNFKIL